MSSLTWSLHGPWKFPALFTASLRLSTLCLRVISAPQGFVGFLLLPGKHLPESRIAEASAVNPPRLLVSVSGPRPRAPIHCPWRSQPLLMALSLWNLLLPQLQPSPTREGQMPALQIVSSVIRMEVLVCFPIYLFYK